MRRFSRATTVLREGITSRAFPAACVEVGSREAIHWNAAFGRFTYDADAAEATPDTIFDLASLTKVMATATLAMRAIDEHQLRLEDPVGKWIPEWTGADREAVTIADLLSHSSGLTAYLPYFRDYSGRPEFQAAIAHSPLEYPPRARSIYSDLGFMLLGFILEDVERRASHNWPGATDPSSALDVQFRRLASYITPEPLTYRPPREWRPRTAPTEHDAWRGRTLVGEVHDENAWALGGVAAHAGLFGTAGAVGAFARAALHTINGAHVLARPDTMRTFIARRPEIPGSSRALGWDTMLPTSSCGTLMHPTAIGHTGYTGTTLWIDWERDLYVVLLTNRVHPSRENFAIRQIRPRFHDAVMGEFGGGTS